MKKFNMFLVSVLATVTLNAATIEQVIVRQQWPWSTDIKVEYKLSAVTNPVDIAVEAYNGSERLALPEAAITGDRYGIAEDGVGTLVIDPVAAFGTAKIALANFKVKLTVMEDEKMGEVLYKIFDLSTGACQDVTRADFYNGKMGDFEDDFAKIGNGYSTTLSDTLIWTGVTNDTKFAKDFLVMRKISAKGVEWQMGSPAEERGHRVDEPQHTVKLTQDYFIGVFPITVYQANLNVLKVSGATRWEYGTYAESHGDKNLMPATMSLGYARGTDYFWPRDEHVIMTGRFLDKLRQLTGNKYEFDLPTEAQWEFACRAGTSTIMYDGKAWPNTDDTYMTANAGQYLGWSTSNSGGDTGVQGYWPVGLKRPNAFGLYDMVGNIGEFCLDTYAADYGGTSGVSENPKGPTIEALDGGKVIRRGGNYSLGADGYRSARRYTSLSGGFEGVRVAFTEAD